jgi:hypothetical protein
MVHHFWNQNRYHQEFSKSGLNIDYTEDISYQVKKGWSIYRNWLPEIKMKMFFQNVAFRIFYIINARINIYFLNKRQQYIIFVGSKPC